MVTHRVPSVCQTVPWEPIYQQDIDPALKEFS